MIGRKKRRQALYWSSSHHEPLGCITQIPPRPQQRTSLLLAAAATTTSSLRSPRRFASVNPPPPPAPFRSTPLTPAVARCCCRPIRVRRCRLAPPTTAAFLRSRQCICDEDLLALFESFERVFDSGVRIRSFSHQLL